MWNVLKNQFEDIIFSRREIYVCSMMICGQRPDERFTSLCNSSDYWIILSPLLCSSPQHPLCLLHSPHSNKMCFKRWRTWIWQREKGYAMNEPSHNSNVYGKNVVIATDWFNNLLFHVWYYYNFDSLRAVWLVRQVNKSDELWEINSWWEM